MRMRSRGKRRVAPHPQPAPIKETRFCFRLSLVVALRSRRGATFLRARTGGPNITTTEQLVIRAFHHLCYSFVKLQRRSA